MGGEKERAKRMKQREELHNEFDIYEHLNKKLKESVLSDLKLQYFMHLKYIQINHLF